MEEPGVPARGGSTTDNVAHAPFSWFPDWRSDYWHYVYREAAAAGVRGSELTLVLAIAGTMVEYWGHPDWDYLRTVQHRSRRHHKEIRDAFWRRDFSKAWKYLKRYVD